MLYLIALMYILLCVRLRVQLEGAFSDGQGSAVFCVGTGGVYLRREFVLVRGERAYMIRFVPRGSMGKKERKGNHVSAFISSFMRRFMLDSLRNGRFDRLMIHLQLGLGDACETAVAAGALRALLCSLLAAAGNLSACELRIMPVFSQTCLHVRLRGIFLWQVGDIMFAALKSALRKRKEGLKWTSIPLRA